MPNSKISLVNNFFLLFWVHSAATMCRRLKQIELKELKLSFTYVLFFFSFFCCEYCVQMMERHQNLLYEEENERLRSSFNCQTPVPQLISRQGEREGNAMLNEKKREERKKKLPLSFGMVIFPAHILTVAMRTSSWGTVETGGREWGIGEVGSRERCTEWFVFQIEGKWRKEVWEDRGDRGRGGKKRNERVIEEWKTPALGRRVRCSEVFLFGVQKEKYLWYVKRFGA